MLLTNRFNTEITRYAGLFDESNVKRDDQGQFATKPGIKKPGKVGRKSTPRNVTVSPGGTIKLKRPRTAVEATVMLVVLQSIHDQAIAEFDNTRSLPENHHDKNMANLRLAHAKNKLIQASKMAGVFLDEKSRENYSNCITQQFSAAYNRAFDEEDHPRASDGRFGDKAGGFGNATCGFMHTGDSK